MKKSALISFALLGLSLLVGCGGSSSSGNSGGDGGTVFVADSSNRRIEVFDGKNNYLNQFGYPSVSPLGIATDPSQNIYVRNALNCNIEKFDSKGNLLLQFGQCGYQVGELGPWIFDNVGRVATDPSGNVWVTSPDFYYMQEFDSSGQFVTMVCMTNSPNCPSATPFDVQPQGIGIDAAGNIYVSNVDPSTGCDVIKFDKTGVYQATIGSAGSGNGQFNCPDGIAFDLSGNMYVVDSGNRRIESSTLREIMSTLSEAATGNWFRPEELQLTTLETSM